MTTTAPIPYLRVRLFVQMFLQFAIWGAWAPVLFKHLLNIGFTPMEAGTIMGTGPLGIMIAPLIAGQLADRYFSTERFLAGSYLATAAMLYWASIVQKPDYWLMWGICLGGMLSFGPTLGLGNSLCFHHLKDARADFPVIRLGGTLGWIGSAFLVGFVMDHFKIDLRACLTVGAALSVINALYCLSLPHTPPAYLSRSADDKNAFAIGKVLAMLKDPSFALFSFIAFVLLVFATFYYFSNSQFFSALGISDSWLGRVQTIGQVAEIVTMLVLPFAYKKLGTKATIAIGLFAWGLRFAIFAIGEPVGLVIAAQALHGVCFAFAIAAAMIYFERISAPDVRGTVQSFLSFIAYGLGMFVGSFLLGVVGSKFTTKIAATAEAPAKTITDWHGIWMVPAIGCFVLLALFLIGFRARDNEANEKEPADGTQPVAA